MSVAAQNHHNSLDNLLSVPELDSIGNIKAEDMDEMLKVNRELIDWNITEEDIDTLLNIDCYYPAKDNAAGIIHLETEMDELLSMIYVTMQLNIISVGDEWNGDEENE